MSLSIIDNSELGSREAYLVNKLFLWFKIMSESIAKFLIVFIIGVAVITIGMTIPLLAVVLLGGLLSGVSALIMLVSVLANR